MGVLNQNTNKAGIAVAVCQTFPTSELCSVVSQNISDTFNQTDTVFLPSQQTRSVTLHFPFLKQGKRQKHVFLPQGNR
jgi:hypothetical protein